jgi:hypothetical protein
MLDVLPRSDSKVAVQQHVGLEAEQRLAGCEALLSFAEFGMHLLV